MTIYYEKGGKKSPKLKAKNWDFSTVFLVVYRFLGNPRRVPLTQGWWSKGITRGFLSPKAVATCGQWTRPTAEQYQQQLIGKLNRKLYFAR